MPQATLTSHTIVVEHIKIATDRSFAEVRRKLKDALIPVGYRDLISVKRLTGAEGKIKQLHAKLGNDIAIKTFRERALPFPDGSIIAALHWNEASSDADNKVLAEGFPGVGLESTFAGSAVSVQFMVKELKKIRRVRRLGIRRLHEQQTWRRGAAQSVLPLPPACKRSRLRFYPLRAYAMNQSRRF